MIRVDYKTISRRDQFREPVGYAVKDGECPWCDREVLKDEPVILKGAALGFKDEDETVRTVDLSDAEWVCQRCGYGLPPDVDEATVGL